MMVSALPFTSLHGANSGGKPTNAFSREDRPQHRKCSNSRPIRLQCIMDVATRRDSICLTQADRDELLIRSRQQLSLRVSRNRFSTVSR